jgi:hypothetical protein
VVSLVLVVTRGGRMHLATLDSKSGVPRTFIGLDDKTYRRLTWNRLDVDDLEDIVEVFEEKL